MGGSIGKTNAMGGSIGNPMLSCCGRKHRVSNAGKEYWESNAGRKQEESNAMGGSIGNPIL
jgi:hypothetical protein